jgi:hypothetical protein
MGSGRGEVPLSRFDLGASPWRAAAAIREPALPPQTGRRTANAGYAKPWRATAALKKRWAPEAGRDIAEPLGNNCAVDGAHPKPGVDCGG